MGFTLLNFVFHFQIVLSFLLLVISYKCQALQGHGEPCQDNPVDDLTRCDHYKGLTCQSGLCECRDPEDSMYNSTLASCVILVGGDCLGLGDDWNYLPCIAGSCELPVGPFHQDKSYYRCSCNRRMSPTPDRTKCLPSYGYDGCGVTSDCNSDELLQCRMGTCLCPRSELAHHFDQDKRKCRSNIWQPCQPMDDTNRTVGCDPDKAECAPDSSSATSFSCQCKGNMMPDWKLQNCERGYMDVCENDADCGQSLNLDCLDGKCLCKFSPEQEWDEAKKSCASLGGGLCTLTSIPHDGYDVQTLSCKTGFSCRPDGRYNSYEAYGYGICMQQPARG